MTTKTYKLDDNVLALAIHLHAWGNRKKADKSKVDTDMDKRMLNATKKLLDSAEWKAIRDYLVSIKNWVARRSMPAFFAEATYLFKKEMAQDVEIYLQEQRVGLQPLIDNFLDTYEIQIEQAKELLGNQFKRSDYPTREYLRQAFGFTTRWIAFDVPKGLPKEIYDIEKQKAQQMWTEAAEQITMALRESFQELISHMAERLTSSNGEKKIFRDSAIDKINEFVDLFKARNLTNDDALATLVDKAKEIIAGVDADDLRHSNRLRNSIRLQFGKINKELEGMIEVKKIRKFDFDE